MASLNEPANIRSPLIAAGQVNGTRVYSLAGEELGIIRDVVLDKRSGKAEYAIMSFGSFLGIGDVYHPLPWTVLTYDAARGGYVVDFDRNRLDGAPAYRANETALWDDPAFNHRLTDYYGGILV